MRLAKEKNKQNNKTTLVGTAVYNVNTQCHSKWFIMINLDQSVTKQAITASVTVRK